MTPEKQKQKLSGQTSIAQKVFQFVPIEQPWTAGLIAQNMAGATGSRIDGHILRGCLMTMVDAGLVRLTSSGAFQRTAISRPSAVVQHKPEIATMTAPSAKPADKPTSAIDLLAGIAKTMRALAGELESAALAIEEGQSKEADELVRLRQLQASIKGFLA